jgi:hypothetical protein
MTGPSIPPYTGKAKALLGKYGWLFLCNAVTINQLTGRLSLLDRQLGEYSDAFRARWDRFEELGVPYVLAAAPMKELIYPEFLPEGLEITAQELPLDRLLRLFAEELSVEIMDLRPALRAAKPLGVTYYRTDTHFSALGAHCVYSELIGHRHCAALGVSGKPFEDFPLKVDPRFRAPLLGKSAVTIADCRIVPYPLGGCTEVAVRLDLKPIAEKLAPTRDIPREYQVSRRPTRIFQRSERQGLPRAVVIGDSFTRDVLPFLLAHFGRIVWLWAPNPPFSAIERERPDIVIQLIAERFLLRSPLMPGWELEPEVPIGFEPSVTVARQP